MLLKIALISGGAAVVFLLGAIVGWCVGHNDGMDEQKAIDTHRMG